LELMKRILKNLKSDCYYFKEDTKIRFKKHLFFERIMIKIAVVGDIILDKNSYVYYNTKRENAPVYDCIEERWQAGGAANVAINLASLGASVDLVGVVGKDREKEILQQNIEKQNVRCFLIIDDTRRTSVRHRIISQTKKIMRIAYEDRISLTNLQIQKIINQLKNYDAIVLVNYQNGMITPQLLDALSTISVPMFIDPKSMDLKRRYNFKLVKINSEDCRLATKEKDDLNGGRVLQRKLQTNICLTRGKKGSVFFGDGSKPILAKNTFESIIDETGAGDTFFAVIVMQLLEGKTPQEAIHNANFLANVATQHQGVYSISKEELHDVPLFP